MKIDTTHNVGDTVFFIHRKTIKKGTITEIDINVNSGGSLDRYYVSYPSGFDSFYPFDLFKTEVEAKKKIEERLKFQSKFKKKNNE